MSDDHVLVEDEDGIRTITFNRPERKNALTDAMRQRFCGLLSAAERATRPRQGSRVNKCPGRGAVR